MTALITCIDIYSYNNYLMALGKSSLFDIRICITVEKDNNKRHHLSIIQPFIVNTLDDMNSI